MAEDVREHIKPFRLIEEKSNLHRIGNYIPLHSLSHGPCKNRVLYAIHNDTREPAAIKIIPNTPAAQRDISEMTQHLNSGELLLLSPSLLRQSSSRQHKRKEYKIMSQLNHPNVLKLHEVVVTEKAINLVLEYAAGGDLANYIATRGRLPPKEAWRIFRQLVNAVAYLHDRHIAHRDLKPENIFLNANNNVLLGDFGLACRWRKGANKTKVCGSFGYMPPCLLQDEPLYIGPEVDVWSLGVCLYRMLYNRLPFHSRSDFEAIHKIKHGKLSEKEIGDDPELLNLFRRMLATDRTKRATIREIQAHSWLTHEPADLPIIKQHLHTASSSCKKVRRRQRGLPTIYEEGDEATSVRTPKSV